MIGSSGMSGRLRVESRRLKGFFERPIVAAIGVAMAMRCEETAAMLPEQRPDLFAVGLRQGQSVQRVGREEFKTSFVVWSGQLRQFLFHFKQEHQPMRV